MIVAISSRPARDRRDSISASSGPWSASARSSSSPLPSICQIPTRGSSFSWRTAVSTTFWCRGFSRATALTSESERIQATWLGEEVS